MSFFQLDRSKCIKDKICAMVCPSDIIKINEDTDYPEIDERNASRCISCGHCTSFCPTDACIVKNFDRDDFVDLNVKDYPSAIQMDTAIRGRRSVRNFKKKEVDKELLKEILSVATVSHSAKNSQPVQWVVVRGRDKIKKIADTMAELYQKMCEVEEDRLKRAILFAMSSKYRSGSDLFMCDAYALAITLTPKDHMWHEDGVIALTNFELAANPRGIGTCWAGYFVSLAREHEAMRAVAGIPEGMYVSGAVMLGHSLFKPVARAPKRNQNIIWNE